MTEPTVYADVLTIENLTDTANTLITGWFGLTTVQMSRGALPRDTTIWGYAHRLANAYLLLIESDDWEVAYPTLRACYELAVHAQWVLATPRAILATVADGIRQRKNLIETAGKAGSLTAANAAELAVEAQKVLESYDEAKRGVPGRFEGITSDFDTPFLYLMYRLLSDLAHPGPSIPSLYIGTDEAGEINELRDPVHTDMEKVTTLHQLCMSLVWTATAVDGLTDTRAREAELGRVAAFLGISPYLELSEKAKAREEAATRRD